MNDELRLIMEEGLSSGASEKAHSDLIDVAPPDVYPPWWVAMSGYRYVRATFATGSGPAVVIGWQGATLEEAALNVWHDITQPSYETNV